MLREERRGASPIGMERALERRARVEVRRDVRSLRRTYTRHRLADRTVEVRRYRLDHAPRRVWLLPEVMHRVQTGLEAEHREQRDEEGGDHSTRAGSRDQHRGQDQDRQPGHGGRRRSYRDDSIDRHGNGCRHALHSDVDHLYEHPGRGAIRDVGTRRSRHTENRNRSQQEKRSECRPTHRRDTTPARTCPATPAWTALWTSASWKGTDGPTSWPTADGEPPAVGGSRSYWLTIWPFIPPRAESSSFIS